MFFRKLLSSGAEAKKDGGVSPDVKAMPPAGLQPMNASLQRKFARGVQYNMKIIIKGDRNVGKTAFFHRLQGEKFKEEYIPTDEIQVTSIPWNYKATDDVVKVEVWDVVDKGKAKKKLDTLKLANDKEVKPDVWDEGVRPGQIKLPEAIAASPFEAACLDAEFVDVFQGTQGVIILLDITKHWTFDYVEREVVKVPQSIPVLILANHRDMGHHRTVTPDEIRYLAEQVAQARGEDGGAVRCCEASMRNGFGLKYVHKFFNLPFLQLQRETLEKQLATNRRETGSTLDELDLQEESDDMNYDHFLEGLTSKRRQQAESLAGSALTDAKPQPGADTSALSAPATPATTPTQALPTAPRTHTDKPAAVSKPSELNLAGSKSAPVTPASTPQTEHSKPVPASTSSTSGGFMAKLFGRTKDKPKEPDEPESRAHTEAVEARPVHSVEDFCPDGGALDASFLDEDVKPSSTPAARHAPPGAAHSDSDEDAGNPMVAGFCEDIESDDEPAPVCVKEPVNKATEPVKKPKPTISSLDLDLSSDEDGDVVKQESVGTHIAGDQSDLDSDDMHQTSSAIRHNKTASVEKSVASENVDTRAIQSSHIVNDNSTSIQTSKDHDINSASASNKTVDNLESKGRSVPDTYDILSKAGEILTKTGDISSPHSNTPDEGSDTESANQAVVVMGDVETLSDEDIVTSQHDYNTPPNSDATKDASPESEAEKPASGLQFEDLSLLDGGFDFITGQRKVESVSTTMSRSGTEPELDTSASAKKKKKRKEKEREKEEGGRTHHKKKKKHKERERTDDSNEEDKKEKKKKRKSAAEKEELSELEKFLGPDIEVAKQAEEGYESL